MHLAACVEPGDKRIRQLLRDYQPAELIKRPQLLPNTYAARVHEISMKEITQSMTLSHCDFVTVSDDDWPVQLNDLGDVAPLGLWVRGNRQALLMPAVSMVGSRTCTVYGEEVAVEMAARIAQTHIAVVSGGAFGIDAAAHRGALTVGGSTVCVLAGGVDVPYPRAHAVLFDRICNQGLLVSESPPRTSAMKYRFLVRNRLIAAWGKATVVVEARVRSGAISTASHAGTLGRDVMAVPGLINNAAAAGCHALIRDGAILVTGAADVVESFSTDAST
ncbi:MAG: DNA-protecting protein DprA [Actinomycetota bacterium]